MSIETSLESGLGVLRLLSGRGVGFFVRLPETGLRVRSLCGRGVEDGLVPGLGFFVRGGLDLCVGFLVRLDLGLRVGFVVNDSDGFLVRGGLGLRVGLVVSDCDGRLVRGGLGFRVGLGNSVVGALVGIFSNSLPGSSTSATTKSKSSSLVFGNVNR